MLQLKICVLLVISAMLVVHVILRGVFRETKSYKLLESCSCVFKVNETTTTTQRLTDYVTKYSVVNATTHSIPTYAYPNITPHTASLYRGVVSLYVIIMSPKPNKIRRDKVRKSWANLGTVSNRLVNTLFFVAFSNTEKRLHEDLLEESRVNRDLYYGLTLENEYTLLELYTEVLEAAIRYSSAKYYLIVHDYTFVNIPAIINVIAHNPTTLMCHPLSKNRVVRDPNSFYYVAKKDYSADVYPDHCQRNSPIIISAYLANKIVRHSKKPMVNFFDVYLFGILPFIHNVSIDNFPKELSQFDMSPLQNYRENKYGFLYNGELLSVKIWTEHLINSLAKAFSMYR